MRGAQITHANSQPNEPPDDVDQQEAVPFDLELELERAGES